MSKLNDSCYRVRLRAQPATCPDNARPGGAPRTGAELVLRLICVARAAMMTATGSIAMKLTIGALIVAGLLAGCANGFDKFYQPNPAFAQSKAVTVFVPAPAEPAVYSHSADTNADAHRMAEDGYLLIGYSSFTGAANRVKSSQALTEGKKLGASVVMIKSDYSNTVSGLLPYTTVNPNQTATVNTTGTVNAYGSGGYASGTYNANSTVTMPGGTTTNFIPYSIQRNSYLATYWALRDVSKIRLGVQTIPLSDDLRHKLERNAGVVVTAVVRGTPAFAANILEGDIIIKINDEDVVDIRGFGAQMLMHAGQTAQLAILRDTRSLTIPVTLRTGT